MPNVPESQELSPFLPCTCDGVDKRWSYPCTSFRRAPLGGLLHPALCVDCGHTEACHEPTQPEAVNHPSHYGGDTTYETIKVIEAWGLNFNLGTATKYISRAGKKDASKTIEDLEKTAFYLAREIATLKARPGK